MADLEATDFFTSGSLLADPYPYYDELRERCPVQREPHHGVVMVTGYEEALAVYHDTARFSSCTAVTGPFPGFPVPLEGDDVSELIEQYRDQLPFSDQLPTFDPPKHTVHRGLLMRLLSPGRLQENEDSMWQLADRQLDGFVGNGRCEFVNEYARPFAMLVIANLLGVPEEDHDDFRRRLGQTEGFGSTSGEALAHTPLEYLYDKFTSYVEDRRRSPRDDVLTRLAQATYKDGSTPEVLDVVRLAANLFAAGGETTVRMLAAAAQRSQNVDLQQRLARATRADPELRGGDAPLREPGQGRLPAARVRSTIGGVDIPAAPPSWSSTAPPTATLADSSSPATSAPTATTRRTPRVRARQSLLPGRPWPRVEGRISIERMLERMLDIRISAEAHGPAAARRYQYVPTYLLRGLQRLHLEFEPVRP